MVVAARNEAARLPALLQALVRQTHPAFEVVVVDDASTDATEAVVRAWQLRHPIIRLTSVTDPAPPRKKHALAQGIAAARYERLAFTDADCIPPPGWLDTLARYAAAAPDEVLVGYSPPRRAPGLLNRLARYEAFITGLLTAAAIGLGRPYMAVGRNLSYSRALFGRLGGFAHSAASLSGDDDLLVQEVVRRRAAPVRAVLAPAAAVPTEAPRTWRRWLRAKRRHLSAGRFYDPVAVALLGLFHTSGALLWVAPLVAGPAGVALLAGRLLVQRRVLRAAADPLDARDLLPAQPLLDGLYTAYAILGAPLGLIAPKRW